VVEQPSQVQLDEASTFLVQRFGAEISDVEHVGEGAWSRCFGFTLNGSELVIRFGRHVDDFQRDRLAARFAARDLPIPQVIEIDRAAHVPAAMFIRFMPDPSPGSSGACPPIRSEARNELTR